MLQSLIVDAVVLLAAAWLVWSFAPASFRRLFTRRRAAAPSYDAALQADELDGRESPAAKDGACGCAEGGQKRC